MLKSILVAAVVFAVLAFCIWWIAKMGGWQQEEGCQGNCMACQAKCEEKAALAKLRAKQAKEAKAAADANHDSQAH